MKLLFRLLANAGIGTPGFYMNLSGATNATVSDAQGNGTLTTPVVIIPSFYVNLASQVNATIADGTGEGTWTAPATGGGDATAWTTVFGTTLATDPVTISAATTVRLDGAHIAQSVDVLGTLIIPVNMSTSLTTGYINIGANGVLMTEGGATLPPQYTHTITLNGAEVGRTPRVVSGTTLGNTNNGVGRSLQVQSGGKLNLFGTSPTIKRTKLNAHAANGASTFTTVDATGWKAGDEIVIGTTDFYGVSTPEKLVLQSNASSGSLTTTAGLATGPRWGVMQYVTDAGMSLTAGTLTSPPAGTPTTLDERAMVINLTRNIVIQGANDTAWTTSKFGAHCMFMGRTSDIKLDGVQFRRVGQAGAIGRYPIHWHMMSYDMSAGMNVPSPTGTFLGAVVGDHYAKNCSVSESGQRMMVIHGTHGVTLDANVGFDITGHALFLEDGAEQDNVITNNVVMKVRSPITANRLLLHDSPATASQLGVNTTLGTTGIWYTNPDNTLTGNWVNDAEGSGIWNSYSNQAFGLSINVAVSPRNIPILVWSNNTATGNKGVGVQTNDEVFDDKGTTGQQGYLATFLSNPVIGVHSFKNSGGGYSNRIQEGQYQSFVCADNAGIDVFGAGVSDKSFMTQSLVVAESLNNATSKRVSSYRAAFATYHELLNFNKIIAVGYTYIEGAQGDGTQTFTGGGLFRLWDLYTQPIFSFSENKEILRINCDAPFRTLPPFKDGQAMNNRNWQVAGVIYDKNGIFGIQGKYWTLNDTFFTHNATAPVNITAGTPANGVVTTDKYFGIGAFMHSDDLSQYQFMLPLNVSRQDTSGNEVGNWNVPDGSTSIALGWMRSFCTHNGGRYQVSFPGHAGGNYFEMRVYHQKGAGDKCLVGVPFGGAFTPVVYQGALGVGRLGDGRANLAVGSNASAVASGYARYLTATGSFANVVADNTGTIYWHDTTNSVLWMQVMVEPLVTAATAGGLYGTQIFPKEYGQTIIAISI